MTLLFNKLTGSITTTDEVRYKTYFFVRITAKVSFLRTQNQTTGMVDIVETGPK
ncbi:hypothetical protein EVA_03129 [gut metagenome]|uniref:Uncharacterized protein n=1 Tax=gut metagenome TaxID=749906 RepID=J9GLI0_9ZZZZ